MEREHSAGKAPRGRRWLRWTLAITVPLALVLYLFGYHVGGRSVCGGCKSLRHFDRVGFGNPGGSRWEIAEWGRVSESACYQGLFDGTHAHKWCAGQFHVDSYRWGITCGLGRMLPNSFGRLYETSGEFRDLVDAEIRQGSLTREVARTVVEFPRYGPKMFLEETGHEPPPARIEAAQEKGGELVASFVKAHPGYEHYGTFP